MSDVAMYGDWRSWPRAAWHRLFGHTDDKEIQFGADYVVRRCADCQTCWTEMLP